MIDREEQQLVTSVPHELEPQSEAVVIRRRPMWPFFAVLGSIVLAVAGGIYWFVNRPDPFKVLIAVDVDGQWWEGSRPAAALADDIAAGLKKIGFEPIVGGDPKVDRILSKAKTPEEAARKLGAGFIISGSLGPEAIVHPIDGGFVELRTHANVEVRFIGDREGQTAQVPVSAWAAGRTKEEALDVLADRVSERLFDAAVPKILEHEAIKSKLDDGDITAVVKLKDAKTYVDLRAKRLDAAKKAYQKADQEHAEFAGNPSSITYHGGFHEQDYLAAIAPSAGGSSRALLLTADLSPYVHPLTMDLNWSYQLETLAWRDEHGKDQIVWTGYHVLGYPSAAPEGSPVVFVEDLFGRAKTLTVLDADGKSRRLRVESSARFDDPVVAPGGKAAALYERPCRECGSSFSVLSLADGKTLYHRKAATSDPSDEVKERYGGYAWLDRRQVVFAVQAKVPPAPDPEPDEADDKKATPDPKLGGQELRIVDIGTDPPTDRLIAQLDLGGSCQSPDASESGKSVVMTCASTDGWVLTFFDASTGEETRSTETGITPVFSPDGKRVAFVRDGDVYLMAVESKQVTRLTKNSFSERGPKFSPDGRRLYFESQQKDPNLDRRIASVVASVALP